MLVLASRLSEIDPFGRNALSSRLSTLILDKRSGEKVYEAQDSLMTINRGPQLIPVIDDRKLIVDFQAWSLELTFTGETKTETKTESK